MEKANLQRKKKIYNRKKNKPQNQKGATMANDNHRQKMKPKKDERVFRKTATKTKKINVKPKAQRGGIRL